MSITTTSSGGNACSVVAELALESLEGGIGRRSNDKGECPVREGEVTHFATVLTRESLRCKQRLVGRPSRERKESEEIDIALLSRKTKMT